MINILSKDIENQENKKSLQERIFNEEENKEGLCNIQKETDRKKEEQNKKIKKLKNLLIGNKKDMLETNSIKTTIKRIPPKKSLKISRRELFRQGKKKKELSNTESFIDSVKNGKRELCRGIDIRNYDLHKVKNINVSNLQYATFDNNTQRPANIETYFNPKEVLEKGKNPGLNVRELHKKGITGKNIGIAVIDQTLLTNHKEYKDQLKMYYEIENKNEESQMHGCATASIAVGKNVGVAPNADLYYIGGSYGEVKNGKYSTKLDAITESINTILEKNNTLDEKHKIRVISISYGIEEYMDKDPEKKAYKKTMESIKKAEEKGIYVISAGDENFMGAGKNPGEDPDKFGSYYTKKGNSPKPILIPMDSRSTASPTGENDYTFYRIGGISRAVPYVAGVYALCCQVKPNINKIEFWKAANQTSEKIIIENEEFKIINPIALIKKLEKGKIDSSENIFQKFLVLDPKQFDQGTDGRRKITSEAEKAYFSGNKQQTFEIFNKQIEIIDYYIEKYPKERTERPSKELLRFHQVQLLAFQGKNEEAIDILKGIQSQDIGITETYYQATIAFLEKNKEKLGQYNKDTKDPNHEFIKRFLDAIATNKTYLEAYGNI